MIFFGNVRKTYQQDLEEQRHFKKYCKTFIGDFQGPYGFKKPGKEWVTRHKPISDPLINAHLNGDYWIAAKAAWYPSFYYLDVDDPESGDVERIIDNLGLSEGQYQLMTSPSYSETRSLHLALRLEHNEKLPTYRLGYEALSNAIGRRCEVYPQLKRKFRLPFGRGQFLIGQNGQVLDHLSWQTAMYWLDKLDPILVESLRYQESLAFPSSVKDEDNPRIWMTQEQTKELYENGLQAFNTRHYSQWEIAVALFRKNLLPQQAVEEIKKWIRKKHNGFSKSVNKGNWRQIDAEIERQVKWIWDNFRTYPDSTNNLDGGLTRADLKFVVDVYPGDVVNQKRLCALVNYYRPRAHHGFVYIPQRIWRNEIANDRTYQSFIQDLESKELLKANNSYRHIEGRPELSYSRKYHLLLPPSSGDVIQRDGRNVHDYYEALSLIFGSVREMVSFTGLPHQYFYYAKRKRGKSLGDA